MSNVAVSMKMSAKQAGALYMKNIKLENEIKELKEVSSEIHEALKLALTFIKKGDDVSHTSKSMFCNEVEVLLAKARGESC